MLHSLFPRVHCRFLSLPLLGPVADRFDDWLATNGYNRVSRRNSIRMLPHVDAELRRRQVKDVANLNTTNRYAKVDLEMKRKAIAKVKAVPRLSRTPWSKDPTVLDWLESL